MNSEEWKERISNRNDMVIRITHLTRGVDSDDAFNNLWKILTDKKLIGSGNSGYISGSQKAVCLQELPLSAIAENLRYEKSLDDKVRYSPFGVRFFKGFIYKQGGRPVIYEDKNIMKGILPQEEYWRIVHLDLHDKSAYVDWTHEREWRVPGDLAFDYGIIEVIVKNSLYYRKLINKCIDEDRLEILKGIRGIITLDSVYL